MFVLKAATGYVAKAPQQTTEVALNIKRLTIIIPAIGNLIVVLILTFWSPITNEKIA
ncbi:hypothetical protein CPJCM30710_08680 [Clostridium polyendosporum]|uniref:Uncharacterized protein n=1 Tax=Clostridium polyendosporum TaxID=69208 RepID=A0A919VFJ0_9CLOT|nr:hypothetical protein CPJCM30710_08680 [Clostridium polyendosporum]